MKTKTENIDNRFQDENYTICNFQNDIYVECPKCNKKAVIKKETPNSYFSERILTCSYCHYSQRGRKETFRVELKCNCSNCSSQINLIIPNVNEKKEKIAVRCKNCGITQDYEPRNISQEWLFSNSGKTNENYFGLPLWINSNFRNHIFWAFNYEHLAYLKKYKSADLRERNNRTHWTMVEKLPDWMKSSKNRVKLIKLINELETK
ncbi:conserved hypothetical protein [Flavobacterium sp. 9R]|uniref:hypothetical protein n=1 Tax=Flavobacterium sp. 9R TaxID=2653143 RepID=UPI0012F13699|nr:hypothetical protein [Flavobacterium sp. 9R]VXB71379.1 conserved hypothetical protein [Flavobacterium sp. 9R]